MPPAEINRIADKTGLRPDVVSGLNRWGKISAHDDRSLVVEAKANGAAIRLSPSEGQLTLAVRHRGSGEFVPVERVDIDSISERARNVLLRLPY